MTSLLNPQPPRPPSSSSGPLRALFVLVGIFTAFLVLVFVVGFFQGFTRAQSRASALPEVKKALSAPGVAELMDAGCPYAMVMNAEELRTVMGKVSGSAPELGVSSGVFCFGPDQLPDCATIARAFVASPGHAPGGFFVTIERRPSQTRQVLCQRRFSDTAEDLGDFGPSTLPQ